MMKPEKVIRVHFMPKGEIHRWGKHCGFGEVHDYILLSEHEKEIEYYQEQHLKSALELAEKNKELQKWMDDVSSGKIYIAQPAMDEEFKAKLAEKDKKAKNLETASVFVIKNQKKQLLGKDKEIKDMGKYHNLAVKDYCSKIAEKDKIIEGLAKRLPLPPNVTISHAFAEKLLDERKPELIAKKRKLSLMKRIW